MMNRLFLLFMLGSVSLLASGGDTESDFLPRVVNFVIFAWIIYTLLADKIKAFFVSRTKEIADRLEMVQTKIKESKKEKENAVLKVEEAKRVAEDMIATAKKEAIVVSEHINETYTQELDGLERQHKEHMELEKRKVQKEVVSEVLKEMFDAGAISVNEEEFAKIILKRVS